MWLRFLSVFDRSSRGPSRPAAGAGREGEQAASSWAGRRTERQRLAQRRSSLEEPARQARSAVAGAAPEGVTSEPSLPVAGDCLAGQRHDTPGNRPLKPSIHLPKNARHEYCKNFPPTRLAFCPRGRMMAVFRFQHATLLEAESDEGMGAEWRTSGRHRSRRRMPGGRAGAREENENNLLAVLDKSSMHPHNRQFSTEGCPSG